MIDVRALRDSQVADAFGRVIPLDATHGQVTWSIEGPHDLALIGRAEQVDVLHGLSSSYACASCCPYMFSDAWCDPGSVTGFPGDTTQFKAWEQKQDCYGNLFAPVQRTAAWSSTNTAVATVNSSGMATAQSTGSTRIQATWTTYTYAERPDGLGCTYGIYHPIAEAICDVVSVRYSYTGSGVPLSSGLPPSGSPPFVNSLTITAVGTPSGGTYSWTTASNLVTLSNATSATVKVNAVGESSARNDVTIQLSYTLNGQTARAQVPLTVQRPKYMGFVKITASGPNTCSSGKAGLMKDILWQIQDQFHQPIQFALPTYDTLTASSLSQ